MSPRRAFGLAFLTALTACQGSCSCGSSDDDDNGSGGSGASTSTPTAASSGSTTSGTGGGDGGASVTGTGGAGQGGSGTGASGQGGSGQGGTGQGGTGQGGAGGAGGSGQGGGERIAERECRVAEDCQLIDDCCTCDAIPVGETAQECPEECEVSSCTAQERGDDATVACVAGRCVAGFECDWNQTICDAAPPNCEDGFTASVIGACYGPCVLATECLSVGSCEQCDGGLACVQQSSFSITSHCVNDTPCAEPDCECLGPSVCNEDDACIEQGGAVVCECINC